MQVNVNGSWSVQSTPPSTAVPVQAQQPPLCIVFVFWEVETDLLFFIKNNVKV